MSNRFGTEAWARELERKINGSQEFRSAGSRWGEGFNGNILFVLEADALRQRTQSLLIRLHAGACGGAAFSDEADHPDAGFVLRAPFALWKEILERRAEAAAAILTGRMKVEGDKMTILAHTTAHHVLFHCACSVETDWMVSEM